jgi:NitT/TauT family transport system substrate-binding protein
MSLVLQESLRAVFYAPYYASLSLGAYSEEGVDVVFQSARSPDIAARALLDGSVHVTWGGPMRVNQTYALNAACDIQCFCEVVTRDPFLLVGRKPRPEFALRDLLQVRLATVSEVPTPWLCLQEDLRREGLDPAAVQLVTGGTMAENAAALARGDVDVIQVFEPYVEELVAAGPGYIWYAAASRGATSYTTFYARKSLIAVRRTECLAMVRAVQRTLKWVHAASPAAFAEAIAAYFPAIDKARLAACLARYETLGIWGQDCRLPETGYDRLARSLVSGGFVPRSVPFAVAVDNSLANEVLRADPPALVR